MRGLDYTKTKTFTGRYFNVQLAMFYSDCLCRLIDCIAHLVEHDEEHVIVMSDFTEYAVL